MNRFFSLIDKILYYSIGIGFLTVFLVNVTQIILRATSLGSLLWSVDFSLFLITWIVALGAALAFLRKEHIVVGFVKEKFPRKVELSIDLITRIILLIFFIILVVTGIEIAQVRMQIKYVALGWPTGWAYLSIPVSGAFICIFILDSMRELVSKIKSIR